MSWEKTFLAIVEIAKSLPVWALILLYAIYCVAKVLPPMWKTYLAYLTARHDRDLRARDERKRMQLDFAAIRDRQLKLEPPKPRKPPKRKSGK